ncbi:MAG: AAA family ATPase [Cyanobacteriota bacterium]|nr:AAA family ATPase [Cyanobacteriota bacterium]
MTTTPSQPLSPWGPFTNTPEASAAGVTPPPLPAPPPWRRFDPPKDDAYDGTIPPMPENQSSRGAKFRLPRQEANGPLTTAGEELCLAVNAAIHLRRPLLVTGTPGTGKTSLAYAIAHELKLGRVLNWPITPRTEYTDGLYRYEALDRLRDSQNPDSSTKTSDFITLGPLGTAFLPFEKPRVLLIDEIDKSDLQLPNELLNLFEEGWFEIPPLKRAARQNEEEGRVDTDDPGCSAQIHQGHVQCRAFPIVVMTSNRERDFPPAFHRRCIRVEMPSPTDEAYLLDVVKTHFHQEWGEEAWNEADVLKQIDAFLQNDSLRDRAIDQLLNALHLLGGPEAGHHGEKQAQTLRDILFKRLSEDG